MRSHRFFIMLLVLLLPAWAAGADAQDAPAMRWGITTNKSIEDGQPPASSEKNGPSEQMGNPPPVSPPVDGHNTSSPDGEKNSNQEQAPSTPAVNRKENVHPQKRISDSPGHAPRTKPSATDNARKTTQTRIVWSDENQESLCNAHLSDLRHLFLKTRHFSIQGASCDTAASAAKFLESIDKCRHECPENFLEQSGYTDRIVRNIRYLEKLGNDRCSGVLNRTASP